MLSAMQDSLLQHEMQAAVMCRAKSHILCRVALDAALGGVAEVGQAHQCPWQARALAKPHEGFTGDLQAPRSVSIGFQ